MRITMKSLCALPSGALEAGKTYDVPTARAKSLIAGGYAVPVDKDPATGGKRKPAARKKAQSRKGQAKSASGEGATSDGSSSEKSADDTEAKDDGADGGAGNGGED